MIGMGFLGLKYKLNDDALHISCLKLFISEDITVKLCNFNLLLLKSIQGLKFIVVQS